jgi:hypothetical protein
MFDFKPRQIILLVIVAFLVFGIGLVVGMRFVNFQPTNMSPTPLSDSLTIFQNASASIQGQITETDGESVVIKNNSGQSGRFVVSDEVNIFTLQPGIKQATASGGLGSEILNKPVVINLNYQNSRFEIVSISVLP